MEESLDAEGHSTSGQRLAARCRSDGGPDWTDGNRHQLDPQVLPPSVRSFASCASSVFSQESLHGGSPDVAPAELDLDPISQTRLWRELIHQRRNAITQNHELATKRQEEKEN